MSLWMIFESLRTYEGSVYVLGVVSGILFWEGFKYLMSRIKEVEE